jgi:hypothetical protein
MALLSDGLRDTAVIGVDGFFTAAQQAKPRDNLSEREKQDNSNTFDHGETPNKKGVRHPEPE